MVKIILDVDIKKETDTLIKDRWNNIGVLKIEKSDLLRLENWKEKGMIIRIMGKNKKSGYQDNALITFEDGDTFEYFFEKLRKEFDKSKKGVRKRIDSMRLHVLKLDRTMEEKIPGYKISKGSIE